MKNENNVNSNEQKLRKEIDTLCQTIRDLKKQLDSVTWGLWIFNTLTNFVISTLCFSTTLSRSDMNNHQEQLTLLETTKEKLQERIKELVANVTEKSEEVKAARAEHKAYKLNAETLINCYKVSLHFKMWCVNKIFDLVVTFWSIRWFTDWNW